MVGNGISVADQILKQRDDPELSRWTQYNYTGFSKWKRKAGGKSQRRLWMETRSEWGDVRRTQPTISDFEDGRRGP